MNHLDELTIEIGDYAFRRTSNPLRKWKNDMFLVNQDFRNSRVIRPFFPTGNCYEYLYINKITNIFFNQSQFRQQQRYSTTTSADYIRKVFFEVNDGDNVATEVLSQAVFYDKFSSNEKQYHRFSPEIKETIKTDFLQLLNSILIGSLKTRVEEVWAKDDDYNRKLDADGKEYKIKINRTDFSDFWKELGYWYFWNGKFYRHNGQRNWDNVLKKQVYDTNNTEVPINPKTEKPFTTIVLNSYDPAEIYVLMKDRNLKDLLMRSIFTPSRNQKKPTPFHSVRIRRKVKTMDYTQSHRSYYSITNAKKFNAKGQASSKGLQANHLYEYHSDDTNHTRGWTFGGITASNMAGFVKQNGYKGKMNYQQSINWILKELD
jgi:hypothetical protein